MSLSMMDHGKAKCIAQSVATALDQLGHMEQIFWDVGEHSVGGKVKRHRETTSNKNCSRNNVWQSEHRESACAQHSRHEKRSNGGAMDGREGWVLWLHALSQVMPQHKYALECRGLIRIFTRSKILTFQ